MENSRSVPMMKFFYFVVLLCCWTEHQGIITSASAPPTPLRPKMTITFPDTAEGFIQMRSLAALPDDSLLLGDLMGYQPITRVITLSQPPEVIPLPLPGVQVFRDVKSLAVVDDHQVLITTTSFNHDVLKLLHLDDNKTNVSRVETVNIPKDRKYSDWLVAAAVNTSTGTFLLSGKDVFTGKSFVDLITASGERVDTIMDDTDFKISHMMVNNGDVYMTGSSDQENASNIRKLNLASKTFSSKIGDLDITALGSRVYFYQGDFDSQGKLYIAVKNTTGCYEAQSQCCRCVMLITAQGEIRVLTNYSQREREVNAVLVTSSGLVTSSSLVEGFRKRRVTVEVFDLV